MTETIRHRLTRFDYDDEPDPQDILGEPEVKLDTTFANVVVVDHIPVAAEDKLAKLSSVLSKVFSQVGTIAENGMYLPIDEETKQTKGYAWLVTSCVSNPLQLCFC